MFVFPALVSTFKLNVLACEYITCFINKNDASAENNDMSVIS